MEMQETLIFRSYGKINWFLSIGDLREDGYHEIQSLIQKVSLYDEIEIVPSSCDSITCDYPIPVGKGSLLWRTLRKLREIYPDLAHTHFSITIKKHIPPGSGLGGGSSNVASLLRELPRFYGATVFKEDLLRVSLALGSDIPFFLEDASFALVQGRGEKVLPLKPVPQRYLVLFFPPFSVSTTWAYRAWDREKTCWQVLTQARKESFQKFLAGGNYETIEEVIWNDFELLVIRYYPALQTYRDRLMDLGCQYVFMTGSGSTLVGVVRTKEEGEEMSQKLGKEGFRVVLASTL